MKRIYADFNNFAADGALLLHCPGSANSIAALGGELRNGEEVVLSDGELEAVGTAFQLNDGSWEARAENWVFVDIESGRTVP